MTTIILTGFFNPLGNSDAEIIGLVVATYPLILDAGNSYTYPYAPYALVYDSGLDQLVIVDTTGPSNTVFYSFNPANSQWECTGDVFGRPSVLATYFTSQTAPNPPGIYIRPVVRQTQIRYNWNTSSITGTPEYILTCTPTDGGAGGGTIVLPNNITNYSFRNLTFGKTYSAGINASTIGGTSVSSIYRTVMTGNPPGTPQNFTALSTNTQMILSWNPPAGTQTPPIGWYVVKDGAVKFDTKGTTITIPFNNAPHTYTVQSVSDTGYSLGASTIIS